MNVIISAKQGAGKTTAARILATGYLNATSWNAAEKETLVVTMMNSGYVEDDIIQAILDYKCRVIVFDGCLTSARNLFTALNSVQVYREKHETKDTARPLLAIFIEQSEAPVINLNMSF